MKFNQHVLLKHDHGITAQWVSEDWSWMAVATYQQNEIKGKNTDGKEVVMPMLAQAWIEHKGYKVAVGSGWNQEQRIRYEANPNELIGKTITVQYFEETKNQEGGISLRFPTVKHVYENGRKC